jgi:crossover junction endodeoxyribonuclease RusA
VTLVFTVAGVPIPQGSMKGFVVKTAKGPRAALTSDNAHLPQWRHLVGWTAKRALQDLPAGDRGLVVGAVQLTVVFTLPRPKRLPKRALPHISRPDLDKLTRAVCDALTGVVWKDDSQVDALAVRKRYAAPGDSPRVAIQVQAR